MVLVWVFAYAGFEPTNKRKSELGNLITSNAKLNRKPFVWTARTREQHWITCGGNICWCFGADITL